MTVAVPSRAGSALPSSRSENAATAVWLLAPPSRRERLQRRLRLAHNEAVEQGRARDLAPEAYSDHAPPSSERIAAIKDLAKQVDLDYGQVAGRFSYERIVKTAGEDLRFGGDFCAFIWHLCSGFAHGRYWSVLGFLTHENQPTDEEGIHNLSLRVDLEDVLITAHVHYALTDFAIQLYEQRRRSPFDGIPGMR
jgi:hypothetical protein